ncbi:4F2 cell-surface antigen heavy chain [Melanotaenia boesemani]|uniref:4F2 cell-surface antigen heavy chain n=1 Tax=Melanotaenia boesemani TaxID=1250792 RepID=UPI001C04108D|nr:4F2 cell-surface antigen heavy chain [Melanotaenia boesemani]
MPLNAGESGYGSVPGAGLSGGVGTSETAPLLIPEPEPEPVYEWHPMARAELEAAAGGPGWRRVRCYMVVLFWFTWVAMLAVSISIIVISPRPVGRSLTWWQRSLFYELQLDLEAQAEGSDGINAVCERLPYLKSLGVSALILEGVFQKKTSPSNLTVTAENMETLAQIQHLLMESYKADLKVMLDFCKVDPLVLKDVAGSLDKLSNQSAALQHALRFWLEQGVAGFLICDTDAAYSEETLLEWRSVLEEFSTREEERIVVVKQTGDALLPLNDSSHSNVTLVNVVIRSILPHSDHPLSTQEVADAIKTQLQTEEEEEDIWPSWTVGGQTSHELKRLLLVLMMTLPGSPAIQYNEEIDQTQTEPLERGSSQKERDEPSNAHRNKEKTRSSVLALFTTLSNSKAREEALLYGSLTFLPFNTSSNFSSSTNATVSFPSSPPILAFLRSWGCVHFLVLLNVGAKPQSLDPVWAQNLPETGVFVASSGMNHLGSTSLRALTLQPHEAMVIKLFKAGSYS